MEMRPEPSPNRTTKTAMPANAGAAIRSTANPAARKSVAIRARADCLSLPPKTRFMRRLATCDGPNRAVTTTPVAPNPSAWVSGTMWIKIAERMNPSTAKPAIISRKIV